MAPELGIRNSELGMFIHPRWDTGAREHVDRRCLASRYDVVLNVMSACLASSRGARLEKVALTSEGPPWKAGGEVHGG